MYLNGQNSFHLARAAGFWLLLYAGANAQTADSTAYTITTLAGGGNLNGISALSVNLTSVAFGNPLTTDSAGNVYLASGVDNRVYKLDVNGVLTVVAGNGLFGDTGDGGNAQDAELGGLAGVAVDASGSVYIAELHGSRVRKVSNGLITTVAGNGQMGYSGDGGPATNATLNQAFGVAVDSAGNLYIADGGNRIRKVANGIITTIAGKGTPGFSGDNGPAASAELYAPNSVKVDSSGNVYIADSGNGRVRKVSNGTITTVAGNGLGGFSGDSGPATSAGIDANAIALDSAGNLYITGAYDTRIRRVTNGIITTIAGNGVNAYAGDGGLAVNASLDGVTGIAVDSTGTIYACTDGDGRIRRISSGSITTFGGGGTGGDGGPAAVSFLHNPYAVAVDSAGNVYIADYYSQRVRKVTNGVITTIAGNGSTGYSGDGGPATAASLNYPSDVSVDTDGNVYIADIFNYRVRKVSSGTITTVAGDGNSTSSGDGGSAVNAGIDPFSIALDAAGTLYVADGGRIRKVVDGIIATIAGNGVDGFSGDNGLAINAEISSSFGIAVDNSGNVYFADAENSRIRKVSNGIITTIVGNSASPGTYSGDGGPASTAGLVAPYGIAVDASGNLYIADGHRIRKVANGIITTIAGTGAVGFSGDGGPALLASLSGGGMAVDKQGAVYIADTANNRVRVLMPEAVTAPPNLLSLSPSSIAVGASGFTLTINGTGFSKNSVVLWNGSPVPTTFVKGTILMATVSASLLSAAGISTVSVGSSNVLYFVTIAPILNTVTPGSIGPGAASFTITVTGSNFVNASTVHFDGTTLTTAFVSPTTLTAVVPASLVSVSRSAVVGVFTFNTSSNEYTFIIGKPALSCAVAGGGPSYLRFEGATELIGDVVLNCSGGVPGQSVNMDVTVSANVGLTSRIVDSSSNLTEALLLINDPAPSQQSNSNVISGFLTGENAVTFSNVNIAALGDGTVTLRIVNLRADVHQFGPNPPGSPPVAFVYVGMSNVPVLNGAHAIGVVLPTDFENISTTSSGTQRTLQVSFTEGFASAFKTRVDPSGNQSMPGFPYNTESGFVNASLVPGAGLADNGTRLILRLTGIPSGLNVYASVSPSAVLPAGDNATAKLVSTDSNGAGPASFISGSSLFGGTYAQISVSNGSAMAVWEITAANASNIETINFQIVLTGMTQAGLGPISTFGSLAPLSTATSPSGGAPLPGFAPDSLTNFLNMTLVPSAALAGHASPISGHLKRPMDSGGPVQVGSNLPFSFNLLNNGPGPASQVTVASNLPPTLAYVPNSCQIPSGTCSAATNGDGSTTISGLYTLLVQPGGAPQFSFNVQPGRSASVGATGSVITIVTSSETDSYPSDNTVSTPFVISRHSAAGPTNAGIFRGGFFWIQDVDGDTQFRSPPDRAFPFGGISGDIPISGDWTGTGTTKVGIYRSTNGLFLLDSNGDGVFDAGDAVYNLGVGLDPTDIPVVGDWNGDGRSKVGIFRQGFEWLLDYNGDGAYSGPPNDRAYFYGGVSGDLPVVGDWTGTGTSKIGIFRLGFFWILDANGNGTFDGNGPGQDYTFPFGGIPQDLPVVGDWNGSGITKVGVFRLGFFWVTDGNNPGDATHSVGSAFAFGGISGDKPVVGAW